MRSASTSPRSCTTRAMDETSPGSSLPESQGRYRELFNRVPIGLYRTTHDGRFLEANLALAELLGHREAESLANKRWSDLWVEPADWERWLVSMDRDGVVRGFETRVHSADG